MKYVILIFFLFYLNFGFSQFIKCVAENHVNKLETKIDFPQERNSISEDLIDRDIVILPIVFHVFNKSNSSYNITEADIYQQLDVLNRAFSAKNVDVKNVPNEFKDLISDTGFRFCIGSREIEGKIEKGIEYFETDEDNLGDELLESDNRRRRIKYKTKGGADGWDSEYYINVWIGEMAYSGGHSTFPNDDTRDEWKNEAGIIINLNTLPGFESKGKILVHEMGHYFNLNHIWGPSDENCEIDDGVEDTPLQYGPYYGCPIGIKQTCNSQDMYMNFMDYTDDDCSLFFTKGQTERMKTTLITYRNSLLESKVLCHSNENEINPLDQVEISIQRDVYLFREDILEDEVEVRIHNINGQLVYSSTLSTGQYSKRIKTVDFARGMYFVTLESGKYLESRKFLIF